MINFPQNLPVQAPTFTHYTVSTKLPSIPALNNCLMQENLLRNPEKSQNCIVNGQGIRVFTWERPSLWNDVNFKYSGVSVEQQKLIGHNLDLEIEQLKKQLDQKKRKQ